MAHNEYAELPEPGVGSYDDPASLIAFELASDFAAPVFAVLAIRHNQVNAALLQSFSQEVGVVGAICDHAFWFRSWAAFGTGTLTSASVASPGEALSSRTPSRRAPLSTSTIYFVPLPRLIVPTAETSF